MNTHKLVSILIMTTLAVAQVECSEVEFSTLEQWMVDAAKHCIHAQITIDNPFWDNASTEPSRCVGTETFSDMNGSGQKSIKRRCNVEFNVYPSIYSVWILPSYEGDNAVILDGPSMFCTFNKKTNEILFASYTMGLAPEKRIVFSENQPAKATWGRRWKVTFPLSIFY